MYRRCKVELLSWQLRKDCVDILLTAKKKIRMRRRQCKHSSPATFDGEPCKLSSDSHEAVVVQRESGRAQKGELGCGCDDFKERRWACLTQGWS